MKSKIIGRRQLLIFTLVGTLCLAVFVNWYYTGQNQSQIKKPETDKATNLGEAQYVNGETDYFESAKLNRTKAHDTAMDSLQSIIDNESGDKETKESARAKLMYMSELIKTESDIENLINAQIADKCLVTLDFDSAEVVLPKGTVNETSLVKIKDIILSKTKVNAENITVVELK